MSPINKSAQIAMEFLLLVGLALVIVLAFALASMKELNEIRAAGEYRQLKEVGTSVEREIALAAQVETGYYREFEVAEKLSHTGFSMVIVSNVLSLETNRSSYDIAIPEVFGNLTHGTNYITTTQEGIFLNS